MWLKQIGLENMFFSSCLMVAENKILILILNDHHDRMAVGFTITFAISAYHH